MGTVEGFYLPEFRGTAQPVVGLARVSLPKPGELMSLRVLCEQAGAGTGVNEFDLKIAGQSVFSSPASRPRIQPDETASNLAAANTAARFFAAQSLLQIDCTQVTGLPPVNLRFEALIRFDNVYALLDPSEVSSLLYTHIQDVPAAVWTISHNLNRRPSVTVTDSSGNQVMGEVVYPNLNQVILTFIGAFSGRADLV